MQGIWLGSPPFLSFGVKGHLEGVPRCPILKGRKLTSWRFQPPLKTMSQIGNFPQFPQMDVSKNNGIPKSSSLIGFSIINHPFGGTPTFGNT